MSPASRPDDCPSPEAGLAGYRSEPAPDGDGTGGEDGALETGRALLAELETLVWWVQQLTALCDLIDSAPPRLTDRPTAD